jgi:hypothetical protein
MYANDVKWVKTHQVITEIYNWCYETEKENIELL